MNRQLHKGAFLAPLLYIGIIAGLIYLQFSGASIFTTNSGKIMLSGTLVISSDSEDPSIASVAIEYEGLQFDFDKNNPLILETRNHEDEDLYISGYNKLDNGIQLFFDRGVKLNFLSDPESDQLVIENNIPQTLDNVMSLRLPFLIATNAQAEATDNFPGLDISQGGERYILALPPRSYINRDDGLINIPGDGLARSIRYTKRAAGNENSVDVFFQDQMEEIPDEIFNSEIADYIDKAYLAWKSNRYNSSTGTWQMRDGNARFSEDILIDLLTEAWSRNEYTRVYNDMRSAADLFPRELTYRSSVFLGNLRKITNDLDSFEKQENIRISNMINQANPMVFLEPDLFRYVTDEGSGTMLDNLITFTESLSPASLDPLEALGLSMNYYLGDFPDPEVKQILSRFEDVFEQGLLPNIAIVDEGFFFQTEPGIADSYYTVLAGETLLTAGRQRQNDQLVSLGKNMILSVLRLSDQMGYLPAQIELTAGAISATLGTTNPEDIYPLITTNPYYPRHVSLMNSLGKGAWVYTLIPRFNVTSSADEFDMTFANTPNRTHYIFFRGVPKIDPLNGMELFGIIWRNAPDFEIYSKGRYYNADSKTLMIKFFDDEVNQEIKFFF